MLLTHNIKLTGHKNLHVTLGFPEVISHRSVLVLEIQGVFEGLLPPCIVPTPGERVEGGGETVECQFLEGSSVFLEIAIINFTSRILFALLFICRLKDVASLVIFDLFYFVLLKYF